MVRSNQNPLKHLLKYEYIFFMEDTVSLVSQSVSPEQIPRIHCKLKTSLFFFSFFLVTLCKLGVTREQQVQMYFCFQAKEPKHCWVRKRTKRLLLLYRPASAAINKRAVLPNSVLYILHYSFKRKAGLNLLTS